jgi:hypothetical protein
MKLLQLDAYLCGRKVQANQPSRLPDEAVTISYKYMSPVYRVVKLGYVAAKRRGALRTRRY